MEMSTSSVSVSEASGSSDSINGLTFGKKIYFEDVGIGIPTKSSCGSSSSSVSVPEEPMAAPAKKGRGVVQGGQPPRCQVEGCKVDLSGAKAYYSRHKVCGMHSKSPKVIVGGIEQRFCQQCSRFHQLPEFDQVKRSCRRRLAGHNERRRKPPPSSILASHCGRLSSSLHEASGRVGGFLMDFTMHSRLPTREVWPMVRDGDRGSGIQPMGMGKLIAHQWQGNSESRPANAFSHMSQYMQVSTGGTAFSNTGIPPDECFGKVSDSSCALSLLSTQPWGSRNQASSLEVDDLKDAEGAPVVQSVAPHGAVASNSTRNSWSFKSNVANVSRSQQVARDLGIGQLPQSVNSQFSHDPELGQQGGRQYFGLGSTRGCGSSNNQMHWSL